MATPWQSVAEIPPGVWFRANRLGHLRDVWTWYQITAIDAVGTLGGRRVKIADSTYLPEELLERFVWTADPYVDTPAEQPCGTVS